jgi:hypothetical protein
LAWSSVDWLTGGGSQDAKATFELKYADPDRATRTGVEFAWKHKEPDEDDYRARHVRVMRAINESEWVDSAVGLARAQKDLN